MKRVMFLVDGFNLYHPVVDAQHDNGGQCVKWLDLRRLCSNYLHMIGTRVRDQVTLREIHHFSATPTHRSKGKQDRHQLYMECLKSSGIHVYLGRFKKKIVKCSLCNEYEVRHEEKESDVAMAAKLLELCYSGVADSIVLVTGDTDLAPAVRTCQRLFPCISICFAFPYRRASEELERLSPGSFKISHKSYRGNQYTDPLEFPDGTKVTKPAEWS